MLWLAMIHGTNGVRTIINDYAERDGVRLVLKAALYLAFVVVVVLGTLVIFTFDPCPSGAPADLLPVVLHGVLTTLPQATGRHRPRCRPTSTTS